MVVLSTIGVGLCVTVIVAVALPVNVVTESVAATVTAYVPATGDGHEISPEELIDIPVGAPLKAHVTGSGEVKAIEKEMGEPTVPFTVMGETTGAVALPLANVMKFETLGEPRPVGMS